MNRRRPQLLAAFVLLIFFGIDQFVAQGVTAAALSGRVTDTGGGALSGAMSSLFTSRRRPDTEFPRVMQDLTFTVMGRGQTLQISPDIQKVANLLNSSWGIRKVAPATSTSPLALVDWTEEGEPVFNFNGATSAYVDSFSHDSRWSAQLGIQYLF